MQLVTCIAFHRTTTIPNAHDSVRIINQLLDEKEGEDLGFTWAYHYGIVRVGYRGGTMEGNACRQLLLKAEILLSDLPQELKIFAEYMIAFNEVVKAAFGQQLASRMYA